MKNATLTILSLSLIALLLGSCSTSSDLTNTSVLKKRAYMKGYHVNLKGNNIDKKSNSVKADVTSVEVNAVEAIQRDDMAQASVSREITAADLAPSPVMPATKELNKKEKVREIKSVLAQIQNETAKESRKDRVSKKNRNNTNLMSSNTAPVASGGESLVLYVILAIILPPLAVGLLYGIGTEFLISLLLTIFFWIPGVIYALIKVFQRH